VIEKIPVALIDIIVGSANLFRMKLPNICSQKGLARQTRLYGYRLGTLSATGVV